MRRPNTVQLWTHVGVEKWITVPHGPARLYEAGAVRLRRGAAAQRGRTDRPASRVNAGILISTLYQHRVAPPGGAGAAAGPNRPQNPRSGRTADETIGHGPRPRRLASPPPPGPTASAFRRRLGRRWSADPEDRCQIVLAYHS